MKFKLNYFTIIGLLLGLYLNAFSQTIIVGSPDQLETKLRNQQILGRIDSSYSFGIRPLYRDQILQSKENTKRSYQSILPLRIIQQFNTDYPISQNDGAMIPAKGYQVFFSPGIFWKYKKLSLQLYPEFVWTNNPMFPTFNTNDNKVKLSHIIGLNHTDNLERFGYEKYQKAFWGQSSLRLNLRSISLGLSTENLWWGPSYKNSLIMSNNAPGFLHFTINTKRPIKTILGKIEFQMVMGKLEGAKIDFPDSNYFWLNNKNQKIPKPNDWRYLNAFSYSFQPKFINGLFLGLNRSFQIYHQDLGNKISDYLPVITPFQKNNLVQEDSIKRDQLASIWFRQIFRKSAFEIYGEYGWNDSKSNIWDLLVNFNHARAYSFGATKLVLIRNNNNRYLRFNLEITQLDQTADRIVRNAGSWYGHYQVIHGYTHQGQVLGAQIGPGGNMQSLDMSVWNKKLNYGFSIDRQAHNLDFFYSVFSTYNNKWVDFNVNFYANFPYRNWIISPKFSFVERRNFQWEAYDDRVNTFFQISLFHYKKTDRF